MDPRIDFYVLEASDDRARLVYACRLIEKAFLQGLRAYVHAGSAAEADAFDTLLWTFGDRAFVPHERAPDAALDAAQSSPVWIGCGAPVGADLLVNLATIAPDFYARYPRTAEFVDAEPTRRDAGRRRFAYYREHGHTPDTHRVTA